MVLFMIQPLILLSSFLFICNSLLTTLASTCVILCTLATEWQTKTVAYSSIAADIHQTLDVQLYLATEFTFCLIVLGDDVTYCVLLIIGPILDFLISRHIRTCENSLCR